MHKAKIGISAKVALFVFAITVVCIGVTALSGYRGVFGSLYRSAGESNAACARLAADSVSGAITRLADAASFADGKNRGVLSALLVDKSAGSDKEWWNEAFDGGHGKAMAGNVILDDASKIWGLPLMVPARNASGELTGIYRIVVDTAALCGSLEKFRVGNTGVAVLVDDRAYLVFYPGAAPFANKFCEYGEMQKMLESRSGWSSSNSAYLHDRGAVASFAVVENDLLARGGVVWRVFVVQNRSEVLAPAKAFFVNMLLLVAAAALLSVAAGFGFGRAFVKPVEDMMEGVKRLEAGDLDFRMRASGIGDETEAFAEAFNRMADRVRDLVRGASKERSEVEKRERELVDLEGLKLDFTYTLCRLSASASALKNDIRSALEEKPAAPGAAKGKGRLADIEAGITTLSRVIDNMTELAKIDTGRMELKLKNVDLRDVLKHLIFSYEPRIRGKGLSLKTSLPKEAVNAYIDPDRIGRVLDTIIDNALKFTDKGGIEIEIKDRKADIEVTVLDTGAGIPTASLGSIFERSSYYAPGEPAKAVGGSFNLVLAKEVIKLHGGSIWAESTPGKSTKITFLLPRRSV